MKIFYNKLKACHTESKSRHSESQDSHSELVSESQKQTQMPKQVRHDKKGE